MHLYYIVSVINILKEIYYKEISSAPLQWCSGVISGFFLTEGCLDQNHLTEKTITSLEIIFIYILISIQLLFHIILYVLSINILDQMVYFFW